jgi:hypothetical protein
MRALGVFVVVLVQGKNGFEGLMTIEANVIVNGHGNLPWDITGRIVTLLEIVDC